MNLDMNQPDPLEHWASSLEVLWRGQRWVTDEDGNQRPAGKPDRSSEENALRAVALLPYHQRIWLNQWTGKVMMGDAEFKGERDPKLAEIRIDVEHRHSNLGYLPTRSAIEAAVYTVAEMQCHNPRVEQIQAATWDGEDRWPALAAAMCQDPEDELSLEICKLLLRGIVIRALHPGSDFPYCPIIFSPHQGAGKSDALKILSGGWYAELDRGVLTHQDVQRVLTERMRGRSVVEIGEFNGITGKAMDSLKSLITDSTINGVRAVYARHSEDWPMTCIIVATTNSMDMLADTENRRHPVLTIPKGQYIDLLWLASNRSQLLAQVVAEWERLLDIDAELRAMDMALSDDGEIVLSELGNWRVQIPRRLWGAMRERSEQHRESSPLEEFLLEELGRYDERDMLRGTDLLTWARNKVRSFTTRQFSEAMRSCGWEKKRPLIDGQKLTVWGRPGADQLAEMATATSADTMTYSDGRVVGL